MPQLHFSISDSLAERLRQLASASGMTLSRYLADMITEKVADRWPEDYLDSVVGVCANDPLEEPVDLELKDVEL